MDGLKKHIIYLSQKPPFPTVDGGTKAMSALLKQLKTKYRISPFYISTPKHPGTDQAEHFFIATGVTSIFRNLFQAKFPSFCNRFYNRKLQQLISQEFQLNSSSEIWVDGFFALVNVPTNLLPHVVYRSHNIEYHLWEQKALNCKPILKRILYQKIAQEIKEKEIYYWGQVKKVAAISLEDSEMIKTFNSNTNFTPYLPEPNVISPIQIDDGLKTFHLGAMNWFPNINALNYFFNTLVPYKNWNPNDEFHIIGGHLELAKAYPWVIQHGFISDIASHLKGYHLLIAPILEGSGVRIKIMDAIALGIPVLTTTLGASGLPYELKDSLVIFEDEKDFYLQLEYIRNHYNSIRAQLIEKYQGYYKQKHI